jgi:hypothetical protein
MTSTTRACEVGLSICSMRTRCRLGISSLASGTLPAYRLGVGFSEQVETQRPTLCEDASGTLGAHEIQSAEGLQALRAAIPSDEWIRELCYDARELVIGCAIHV